MEVRDAAVLLRALGSEPRLRTFRAIAQVGKAGIPAGRLATSLDMAPNTLSFHLKELSASGLIQSRRFGRSIHYRLEPRRSDDVLRFLMNDCSLGNPVARLDTPPALAAFHQIQTMNPENPNILFVCKHNSARSQMAEALLERLVGDRYNVFSAGYNPQPIDHLAVRVMNEIGLDISDHESKSTSEFLGWTRILYAIFVCRATEEDCPKLYPFAQHQLRWTVAAPNQGASTEDEKLANFRAVRDDLDRQIRDFVRDELGGERAA